MFRKVDAGFSASSAYFESIRSEYVDPSAQRLKDEAKVNAPP